MSQYPSGNSENGICDWKTKIVFKKSVKVSAVRFSFLESLDIQVNRIFCPVRKYHESVSYLSLSISRKYQDPPFEARPRTQRADYVLLKVTANGRFGFAPTLWALVARTVGN